MIELFRRVVVFRLSFILLLFIYGFVKSQILIDHNSTDITKIPQAAIENAKDSLHIAYGHTSHGSQITYAMLMSRLVAFANAGCKGLSLPQDIFAWDDGQTPGTLDLRDYIPWGDRGTMIPGGASDLGNPNATQWATDTRTFLNDATNADINVIMWSWCGQLSSSSAHRYAWTGWDSWDADEHCFHLFEDILYDIGEGSDLRILLEDIGNNVGLYLLQMSELERDFPDVQFVYMTGHLDGTGLDGNLNKHNEIIRDYCSTYGKILYDFADIETYDPDGVYYGDQHPTDGCNYDANGNGVTEEDGDPGNPLNGDQNWALNWQAGHTQFDPYLDADHDDIIDQQPDADWFSCSSSHTYPLNGNLKAYAAWRLFCQLAGWEGPPVLLQTKIWLEGCYNAGSMTTYLNSGGFLSTTSPYAEDARTISEMPDNITDWILIKLRTSPGGAPVSSKSALLRNDGYIVDDDGETPYITLDVPEGDYHIEIHHRNHIDVMSANSHLLLSSSSNLYNFTTDTLQYYAYEAADLGSEVYGMLAGDANETEIVNSGDYLVIKTFSGSEGYYNCDCNMTGVVNSADYLIVKPNSGKASNIP